MSEPVQKSPLIDYKNIDALRRYTSERGKINPRRVVSTDPKKQRLIALSIKRARYIGLMPHIVN